MPKQHRGRAYLVKSEPSSFSFDDLLTAPGRTTPWDGIRNYQSRNLMRDEMRVGDPVLFYHSGTPPTGVVGLAEVASEARPDPTQFDPEAHGFDPKSSPSDPRWYLVDLRAVRKLPRLVTLEELKAHELLQGMSVARRGNRLSVMPEEREHLEALLRLAEQPS